MTTFRSDFLNTLQARGFIHQISDPEGLDSLLSKEMVSAYIGFDCTARSLHAGSLVQIMMLYWLQQTGHRPIALMGGGTTRIGDPSGRDESRKILSDAEIEANKQGIRRAFDPLLHFGESGNDAIMPDNAEWLLKLNYIDVLRDVGRHFSVNQMIQRDSVRLRLEREQHLSLLEFNYMVLQAYDYVELHRRYGARLQMGGSDQWGNIVSGVDLGRRMEQVEMFALTTPLLTTATGAKMGKTAEGAVWLNPDMLSAYEYWQFWRNAADADVGRFLKLFTILPLDEIERLAVLQGEEINEAKKVLATEATALLHGRDAAKDAEETARRTFEAGQTGDALPSIEVERSELEAGIGVLSAFVRAGLATSNGEVRRLIRSGGIKVNDTPVSDERALIGLSDLSEDGAVKLSSGRKKHALLRMGGAA
ncbi:tyrosine--tRNA ligase [Afifella sp. JA880]|uniref:tyrosine--tRNA ligase n=1 Tax=Afifella sp. JA880 TaxID=2975280 RepID=UPI0021BBAC91|nr:tyrosine--tRNA ligase [Afifella sp. JA880]MCT8266068.1 tyrosine--tRNA ligase [Afifella sp. JA880]